MAEINARYDKKRKWLKDIVPLSAPFTIYIEPTRMCNIKCRFCLHATRGIPGQAFEKAGIPAKHMEMELFDRFVSGMEMFTEHPRHIVFAGMGEPLMNPCLEDMVSKLRNCGYQNRITVQTNGILLTPDRSLKLVESGVNRIEISIQGLSSKSYKDICEAEINFEELTKNIRSLYAISRNKTEIYVKIIDANLTESETQNLFYEIFGEICDIMYVEHLVKGYYLTQDYEIFSKVDETRNFYNEKITKNKRVCAIMFYMLGVCSNGDVFPCCRFGMLPIGNLKTSLLPQLWNGEKHRAYMLQNLKYGYADIM